MIALVMVFAIGACSSEPLEFPDWTIPVPEGTPIIGYAAIPMEERTERIELVEDLVIGGQSGDSSDSLYRPQAIAVDRVGRIYVADAGAHHVKVFDPQGQHLRDLGREGQGPGEFSGPTLISVAESRLVVGDMARLSLWSLQGTHIRDVSIGAPGGALMKLFGLPNDNMVAGYMSPGEGGRLTVVFARWDAEGQGLNPYASFPYLDPITFEREGGRKVRFSVGTQVPVVAVSENGSVYVSQCDEYQVLSMTADGTPRWALRVALPRQPLSRQEIDAGLGIVRRRYPEAKESEIDWPDTQYSLRGLWVDGRGHLYVFPYAYPHTHGDSNHEVRPVDVYSQDGERLFGGVISAKVELWKGMFVTAGDAVYDIRTSQTTGEYEVVRYRLVTPF
jgi:hypothetical protein